MNSTYRWGLLLINLGTPDSPKTTDVRRYLREFLSDPRVLDINPAVRSVLLNAVILPFRPKESGEAYETIWTERGSPLMTHSRDLVDKMRSRLGGDVQVELAMRYQNPTVESALNRFADNGVDRIVVFPLFPQYSSAAYGSAVEKVVTDGMQPWNVPAMTVIEAFYDHPAFIRAFAAVARPVLDDMAPDRVLFSYHGVPERHCTKSDPTGSHCLKSAGCCDRIVHANRFCYRAQCMATTRALAAELGLAPDQYEVAFQSRLGRDPWIRPYTDIRLEELAKAGVERVAVMCPAFVADCLETIEEIGMRGDEDFRKAGGKELRLIPSLNSSDAWADAVVEIAKEQLPPAWSRPTPVQAAR